MNKKGNLTFYWKQDPKDLVFFVKPIYGLYLLSKGGLLYCFMYLIVVWFFVSFYLWNVEKYKNAYERTFQRTHHPTIQSSC